MKSGNIFWGAFLVSIGIFILLDNLDIVTISVNKIWVYWPILLIIWGVTILKIPAILKIIMSGISGLFLALVIASLMNFNWNEECNWNININDENDVTIEDTFNGADNNYEIQKLNYQMNQNFKIANLTFDGGAGNFNIGGTCEDLFLISSGGAKTNVNTNLVDTVVDVNFDFSGKSFKINNRHQSRFAKINLNADVLWNLDVDAGAAKFNMDLSQYKVNNVNIDAGAIDLNLKIGDLYKETNINISSGASNLKIDLPQTSSCIIHTDITLSEKQFNGFKKIKPGQYVTENYQNSSNTIQIMLDGALSNISINRY